MLIPFVGFFRKIGMYIVTALTFVSAVFLYGKAKKREGAKEAQADLREADLEASRKLREEAMNRIEDARKTVASFYVDRVNERLHAHGKLRADESDGN